jgi:putative DNA primase/helicase
LIIALSGLIGRKLGIRPKQRSDWHVVVNLWGCIVGPPGYLKTPAVEAVMRALKRLVADAMEAHKAAIKSHKELLLIASARRDAAAKNLKTAAKDKSKTEAELQALAKAALADDAEDEPKCRRYLVNDFTIEKLAELLNDNHNGLIVYRDELSGLLNMFERDGHQADRQFLLECWAGVADFQSDRIARGSQYTPFTCLAVFGTIQPGPLAKYMQGTIRGEEADGFIPRLQVMVYPDPPKKYVHGDEWPDNDAKNRAYEVFKAIDQLNPSAMDCAADGDHGLPYLHFSPEAQQFFNKWYIRLKNRNYGGELTRVMASHLAKYGSLMPSLALIFHLAENYRATQLDPVSLEAAQMAVTWCDYLEAHARRVYLLCADGDISAAENLAERIKSSLPNPFTCSQVAQKGWTGLSSTEDARRAVGILEDRGWVKTVEIPSSDPRGRGRPSEKVYINPKVLQVEGRVDA